MDKATFQQGLAYLGAAFDIRLSHERAAVYWDQLGGLLDEPFLEAIKTCVAHDERFPTVARIRYHYQDTLRRELLRRPALPRPCRQDRAKVVSLVARLRERLR
jgi:hypothetical protein